jgi:hypothetical protein
LIYTVRPCLIHTYHAVPLTCRAAQGSDCVFPIWFTQCGRVWFTHTMRSSCRARAMSWPCRSVSDFSRPRHSVAWARHGHGMACVNYHRSSRDGTWTTCPRSASFDYHAEFHEGCYQKHTSALNCSAACEEPPEDEQVMLETCRGS